MTELDKLPVPLLAWYRENARVLPWRSDPTPYHVWVSEIMLQQTRVAAVLDYYKRFLEVLPTVKDLAECPEDRLMKLWQGLGYYSRARNLQKAARQVMADFGGTFPDTFDAIRTLSGVGDYTAGAISSIAFGRAVPAVDGNVLRVVSRLTLDRRDVTKPETKKDITAALQRTMPREAPGDFNQALMELGATVCLPNGAPLCEKCPARDFCAAHRAGAELDLPVKSLKKERRVEERTVWLIFREGKVALRKRPDKGLLAGLWEYPNEREGSPCPVTGKEEFAASGKHIFTHIEWHMTAYTLEAESDALPPGWVWADKAALRELYSLPSAFAPFAHLVEEHLALTERR
ncbi:MAG: A/G-specific adenine glycosylase [Oscillospiraceae bacterium]|nr:A/G-specific adenine glycosylase [Oscillospiraceae bacterium]